jgi:putative addiction module component (TIGR02574 family)
MQMASSALHSSEYYAWVQSLGVRDLVLHHDLRFRRTTTSVFSSRAAAYMKYRSNFPAGSPELSLRLINGVETRGKSRAERQHGLSERSELACFRMRADYNRAMATIAEIEKLAQDLSEKERAVLAAHLLGSLPPVLHDEDEGIAEALRRDAEIEANPSASLSLEQLDQQIARRRT